MMNVYQTASNFNHTNIYYQPNLLVSTQNSPNVNIIYSDQLTEDNFYSNLDNANNSLIHMFMKNEQKNDQKLDNPYQNSTVFNSPSPSSSSYNSSSNGGQIMYWTPNSQNGQDESVVLCQLDDLTKSLNNQMNDFDNKKCLVINQNSNVHYNLSNIPTPIDETDQSLTSYDFNSNSIITQKLNAYNNNIQLVPNDQLFIQQQQQQHQPSQFNTDLIPHQSQSNTIPQPSIIDNRSNHHLSHLHSSALASSMQKPPQTINSNIKLPLSDPNLKHSPLITQNLSTISSIQSTYTPALPSITDSSMQSKLNQVTQPNQIAINDCKIKQESNSNNNLLNMIIAYDSEGRPIRNTANKKERRRTLSINNAFSNLRDCIPNVPADTKLSKIKTLRLATSYISFLMELLDDSSPSNGKRSHLMMTCEDFKVDLQRFKGRSKNITLICPKLSVSSTY